MVRARCGVQCKDRKRVKDLMLGLNEVIDQFVRQCLLVWPCVEEREVGHVFVHTAICCYQCWYLC